LWIFPYYFPFKSFEYEQTPKIMTLLLMQLGIMSTMNMMSLLFRGNCILEIIIFYCGDMYFFYSYINMNQV